MIAAAAPTVAAATWNPFTWLPHLAAAAGVTVVTGTGAVVTTALSAIAMPFAIGAFGLAAFRGYSAWKENRNMQKNELKSKVLAMIDAGYQQVMEQIAKYREKQSNILDAFDKSLTSLIEQKDKRLAELKVNRPAPRQIQMLEDGVAALGKQIGLQAEPAIGGAGAVGSSYSLPLVDDLRSAK